MYVNWTAQNVISAATVHATALSALSSLRSAFVKKYMRGYMENYDLDGIEFDFFFGDDLAAAKRKGKTAKVEVRVLTDLKDATLPTIKVRGNALGGGMQKDGIATFIADDATFVKGENAVEIIASAAMTLHDFSVHVKFQ